LAVLNDVFEAAGAPLHVIVVFYPLREKGIQVSKLNKPVVFMQVIDESYALIAKHNFLRPEIQYPSRGSIYDRKGKLLVYNF